MRTESIAYAIAGVLFGLIAGWIMGTQQAALSETDRAAASQEAARSAEPAPTAPVLDQAKVTEYVAHSWYQYQQGDAVALHPYEGETMPTYTGPTPPYERLYTEPDSKYSWLKSPRYDDEPMEVGPLSRMLVAYVSMAVVRPFSWTMLEKSLILER